MTNSCAIKCVLVCDDDDDIRDFLGFLLHNAGYQVLKARSYSEVMEHLEHAQPHLILLDIRMPEWDGFYVAEMLRARRIGTPIIFMTAHDNKFCRIYSPAIGAAGYFTKPLDTEALLAKVGTILRDTESAEHEALSAT